MPELRFCIILLLHAAAESTYPTSTTYVPRNGFLAPAKGAWDEAGFWQFFHRKTAVAFKLVPTILTEWKDGLQDIHTARHCYLPSRHADLVCSMGVARISCVAQPLPVPACITCYVGGMSLTAIYGVTPGHRVILRLEHQMKMKTKLCLILALTLSFNLCKFQLASILYLDILQHYALYQCFLCSISKIIRFLSEASKAG